MSVAVAGQAPESSPEARPRRVLVVGNPNAGKSTIFNALTGGRARVGNYAGTTVDRKRGHLELPGFGRIELVDVPGTFSLAARSPEERLAIDSVLGLGGEPPPDALVVVGDAPRLQRSLYLLLQLLELEVPLVFAVNLMDEARQEGQEPDPEALTALLGVPVVGTVGRTGEGLQALKEALVSVLTEPSQATPGCPHGWPEALAHVADEVGTALPTELEQVAREHPSRRRALGLWLLLSVDDADALPGLDPALRSRVLELRSRAQAEGHDLEAEIVGTRYAWIDARAHQLGGGGVLRDNSLTERLDRVLLHPLWGTVAFFTVMALVFMALFSWSDPVIGAIEDLFGILGDGVGQGFAVAEGAVPALAGPVGILGELVVNGLIGGVGAVLVFLPQIGLLFFFLALLEDSGYLARAAHLMDRVLRAAGLPGQAFVPLLSGYACAVPAILATRTLPRFRDRLLTMMVLPLTSCSARLPVYTLLIAALFPPTLGALGLPMRPMALFGMYLFSTLVTVTAAVVLGRVLLPEQATAALIELPPYRVPDPRVVFRLVVDRCGDFLREAGRIILWATVVLWALLSFPRYAPEDLLPAERIAQAELAGEDVEALAAPLALERSFAGRIGKTVEPVIEPLGYDWRIGVGLIGAFAAREVFVSTMGLVHGIGEDVDEESAALRDRIRQEVRADGSPLYTPLVGISLMVFFALAMQCLSTLAVLRKETGGWRWPGFILTYMTLLAWFSAFFVYQGGRLLGFG